MNRSAPPGEAEVEDATTEEMDYLSEKLEMICLANTRKKTLRNITLLRQLINGQNLAETDTISPNKQIEAVLLGKPTKIVEIRAGFLAILIQILCSLYHSTGTRITNVYLYHICVFWNNRKTLDMIRVLVPSLPVPSRWWYC